MATSTLAHGYKWPFCPSWLRGKSIVLILCSFSLIHEVKAQCDPHYDWTVWSDFSSYSATGTIFSGGNYISVTMSTNYPISYTNTIYNYPAFDLFQGPLPANAPVPMTTWFEGTNGETTMCFSEPVTNPALLLASLGNFGEHVTLTFSAPYTVVYDGNGMDFIDDVTLLGHEGYAIIVFYGTFDCITINSTTPEYYTNITWGLNPPLFEVIIEGDTVACENTTLFASGGVAFEWNGGDSPYSSDNTFWESGSYSVTATDAFGCTALAFVNLEIHPVYEMQSETNTCEGQDYYFYGQNLTQSGLYETVLQTEHGCDSTILLQLEVLPITTSETHENICEGDIFYFNGVPYHETGTFFQYLQNQYGCDSIALLHLEVHENPITEIYTEICEGEVFYFNGVPLTTKGLHAFNLKNEFNCDSTIVVDLNFKPGSSTDLTIAICAGESYAFDGQWLSTSGEYIAIYPQQTGCDSIVNLTLTVQPIATTTLSDSICAGSAYFFHGDTLFDAGMYTAVLQNQSGCDSIVNLTLNFLPATTTPLVAQICKGENYSFYGSLLTTSGTYSYNEQDQWGCDSILSLSLTVHDTMITPLLVQICKGQSYFFQGQNLVDPGVYVADLQTVHGCDSTVQLSLSVVDVIATEIMASLCDGQSYFFDGVALTTPGTYVDSLVSSGGCDSIATLHLTIQTSSGSSITENICEGESFIFNGQSYTTSGEYLSTLQNSHGCDSIVTLILDVLPATYTNLDVQICSGEAYNFNSEPLTMPGQYSATLQNSSGCDSIIALNLEVVSSKETDIDASICQGSSYVFGGNPLFLAGIYIDSFITIGGCDSIVSLTLKVNTNIVDSLQLSICAGDTLSFHGDLLMASGTYTAALQTDSGCDSLLVLELLVNESVAFDEMVMECDSFRWPVTNITYFESGVYMLKNASMNGCDSTHRLLLTIHPSYQVDEIVSANRTYTWPANGMTYQQSGKYFENLMSNFGCDSLVTLTLSINRADEIFIPNVFSPDGDGINDKFTIYGGASLAWIEALFIYDRWGNLLATINDFPPNNPEYGWDGSYKSKFLDPGVFVYTALLRFDDETSVLYKGDVMIVK